MTDDRLEYLLGFLRNHHPGGFVNNVVFQDELLSALDELKGRRGRPTHCPGCDGDRL